MLKNKLRILFIDCETGGLSYFDHSVLSMGMCVWDGKLLNEACLHLLIREDNIVTTPESLGINHIDLHSHMNQSLSVGNALHELELFIKTHFPFDTKVIIGGHNVHFDVGFLKRLYSLAGSEVGFHNVFSHRLVDTASILWFMYINGVLNKPITSLGDALDHFGIINPHQHNALEDAKSTAKLFHELVQTLPS